jgi:hypothetical protein
MFTMLLAMSLGLSGAPAAGTPTPALKAEQNLAGLWGNDTYLISIRKAGSGYHMAWYLIKTREHTHTSTLWLCDGHWRERCWDMGGTSQWNSTWEVSRNILRGYGQDFNRVSR